MTHTSTHPCYSPQARHKYARMHLPVAPSCNISCNYCNRKYDCQNESRPGVTSEVLSPQAAAERFAAVKAKIEHLSVVGVAGPGDALADWARTKETLQLIRQMDRDITFCLSTNGLLLPELAGEILSLGVRHVTVTMNCLDAEVGAKIYRFIHYHGQQFSGEEGAALLIANQLKGIAALAAGGALVKVNSVLIEGINDTHVRDVVKKVRSLGAHISNIMPLIPAPGSAFAHFPPTSQKILRETRKRCEPDLTQMYHCRQCRADAIGLLGADRREEFGMSKNTCRAVRSAG